MADTWFKAQATPAEVGWMFDSSLLDVNKPRKYIHFELYQNGEYCGWVFITPDGKVEFGEPAA